MGCGDDDVPWRARRWPYLKAFTLWLDPDSVSMTEIGTCFWITASRTWLCRAKVCAKKIRKKQADVTSYRLLVFDVTALAAGTQ